MERRGQERQRREGRTPTPAWSLQKEGEEKREERKGKGRDGRGVKRSRVVGPEGL